MLGIKMFDQKANAWIKQQTKLSNVMKRVAQLNEIGQIIWQQEQITD